MSPTLRESLSYDPVELAFGTSGLRGLVRDITSLEAYINARAFVAVGLERGEVRPGSAVSLAGDLRPSTTRLVAEADGRGEILQAVARAVVDSGLALDYLGHVPSPALMLHAVRRGQPSVMVTGSHIPFDRNGIKFNGVHGEVLKSDEPEILDSVRRMRAEVYATAFETSIFDARGMLRSECRPALPTPVPSGREEYVRRYLDAFPRGSLAGRRILVWQHSAVGRDILAEILASLGAEVIAAGRSDAFVAVDTEAIGTETLELLRGLAADAGRQPVDAVVSTDGDSDRPLIVGVEAGELTFYAGDLVGLVTAEYLGARHAALPISANDAVDAHLGPRGVTVVKTRIGSPYVIAAMREVGWEANGGFLTASPLRVPGGGMLDPLPTRDAVLPILAVLCASLGRGTSLAGCFARLPRRFSSSTVLRSFAPQRSRAILALLAPPLGIRSARLAGEGALVTPPDGPPRAAGPQERARLAEVSETIARACDAASGFGAVAWIEWLDGVRMGFEGGDVAHIRPSGNAPELRLYAVSGSRERAAEITRLGAAEGGVIDRLERVAEQR